ncbi:recombinase family protein [Bacteroides sp. 51]|uniref:recombinase family protein n=1 Tax=Bacteroides sp. 51 TaxID=2302938 RepID=UPI0013D73EA0|nr:recombinase family protein [Bacteroides sp. 51]NDV84854.1 recombinase family protein [Bacteroides sp. 51]
MKIGYARVSTPGQKLDIQKKLLKENGCELIFTDKYTGTRFNRPGFEECLQKLRKGDTLVVCKLDRLGRSLRSVLELLDKFQEDGIAFISLQDNITTEGHYGKLMTNILGALAQFERDVIVERTSAGRQLAKEKGVVFGRPKGGINKEHEAKVSSCASLYRSGESVVNIMKVLNIKSLETIYRYLRKSGIEPNRKVRQKK